MKISQKEAEQIRLGQKHQATITRLRDVIEGSTLTRKELSSIAACVMLAENGGDEASARESVFRLLTLLEAAARGERFQIELERRPELEELPEAPFESLDAVRRRIGN